MSTPISTPERAPRAERGGAERVLQRLDWKVIRRLDGLLQGDYRTLFYGYGVDFADLREYQPEDEDQSGRGGLRQGSRVRHAMFGVGTVMSVEELDDDVKVVVTFQSVGRKTLRAKYARLQPA